MPNEKFAGQVDEKKPKKCQQAKYKIYRPKCFQKSQISVIWPRKMPNGNPGRHAHVEMDLHRHFRWSIFCCVRGYSIIGYGFTVNLGSDSLGKSTDFRSLGVSNVTSDSHSLWILILSVTLVRPGGWNFPQYFYGMWYLGHPLTSTERFTEIFPGEPLRRGS